MPVAASAVMQQGPLLPASCVRAEVRPAAAAVLAPLTSTNATVELVDAEKPASPRQRIQVQPSGRNNVLGSEAHLPGSGCCMASPMRLLLPPLLAALLDKPVSSFARAFGCRSGPAQATARPQLAASWAACDEPFLGSLPAGVATAGGLHCLIESWESAG